MKRLKKLVAICLACVTILSLGTFAGCKKTPNGEQDLEIYSLVQGYGAESINTLIEEFKKQDWVKENYPNLTISLSTDDLAGTAIKKDRQHTAWLRHAFYWIGNYEYFNYAV